MSSAGNTMTTGGAGYLVPATYETAALPGPAQPRVISSIAAKALRVRG
jgi:hypothetical protein